MKKNPIFSLSAPFYLLNDVAKRGVSENFIFEAIIPASHMAELLKINKYSKRSFLRSRSCNKALVQFYYVSMIFPHKTKRLSVSGKVGAVRARVVFSRIARKTYTYRARSALVISYV